MTAVRVYLNPFDTMDALKADWSAVSAHEARLCEAYGKDGKLKGFIRWVEENCTGRFFISVWWRTAGNGEGHLQVYFEDAPSAFTTKMRWS